jgi:hypothetical protein
VKEREAASAACERERFNIFLLIFYDFLSLLSTTPKNLIFNSLKETWLWLQLIRGGKFGKTFGMCSSSLSSVLYLLIVVFNLSLKNVIKWFLFLKYIYIYVI